MRAPLSFAIITAGEPSLEGLVASVREHVRQVCIVWAAPHPAPRYSEVQRLADRFTVCTECLDADGKMADFSVARAASFALADEPFVSWGDSDDTVVGAQYFDEILGCAAGIQHPRLIAPYEYRHDPTTGECDKLQMRERIVRNDGSCEWRHPVHETLARVRGERSEDQRIQQPIRWVHGRKDAVEDRGRNMRILLRAYEAAGEKRDEDAWLALQLGVELAAAGEARAAIPHFERYVELSGWDEERAWAMLQLSSAHHAADPYLQGDAAFWWARQARALRPGTFAPVFQLAKLYSLVGLTRGDEGALAHSSDLAEEAAGLPAESLFASNPTEERYFVHDLVRVNAEVLGDWRRALRAAERALLARPRDGACRLAVREYEAAIRRDEASAAERAPGPAPATGGEGGLRVLFFCGPTMEVWNPEIAERQGIGGSETAVIEIAKRLAEKRHSVKVVCNCGRAGLYEGVEYTSELALKSRPDVFVAWRDAEQLTLMRARVKLLWVHDVRIHNPTPFAVHLADRVLPVSEWHARALLAAHGESVGLTKDKIRVMRNGIDPTRFLDDGRGGTEYARSTTWDAAGKVIGRTHGPRDPLRVVYSSSPERGLGQLLDVWPRIRAAVPGATLAIYYGTKRLENAGKIGQAWAEPLIARMKELGRHGVTDRGRVGQATLAREMLGAGVWTLPSWLPDGHVWTETSCIGAQEALAAGLRCVVTPHGALSETVFQGTHVNGESGAPDEAWGTAFAGALVRALTRAEEPGEREAQMAEARRRFDWDGVAGEWDGLLTELVEKARAK